MSSKRKRKEKEKEKENRQVKLRRFALKPEYGPRGIRRKPLKPGALNQLVGSHRLSARYMVGRWSLATGFSKSFEVRGEA